LFAHNLLNALLLVHVIIVIWRGWRDDLVEGRRQLRGPIGVGGPGKTSSFHVIGEIFDRVYELASLSSLPLLDVQTVTVPPGGATVVDLTLEVPGEYALVDHALPRVAKGLIGKLVVE
jgi:hypothetical protein